MDEQPQQNAATPKSQTGPIIAIIGLIVIVVVAVLAFQGNKPAETQNTTVMQEEAQESATEEQAEQQPNQQSAAQPSASVTMTAGNYKDGTYTAVGDYISPGGTEQLGVTLTIKSGVITSSDVEVKATRPISKTRQTDFKDNYKAQVKGKNINEIVLTKVSGSSLSPKGFNDAVEKIKAEAQQS
jgi:uncharacterized protein with FMN-binding domain